MLRCMRSQLPAGAGPRPDHRPALYSVARSEQTDLHSPTLQTTMKSFGLPKSDACFLSAPGSTSVGESRRKQHLPTTFAVTDRHMSYRLGSAARTPQKWPVDAGRMAFDVQAAASRQLTGGKLPLCAECTLQKHTLCSRGQRLHQQGRAMATSHQSLSKVRAAAVCQEQPQALRSQRRWQPEP